MNRLLSIGASVVAFAAGGAPLSAAPPMASGPPPRPNPGPLPPPRPPILVPPVPQAPPDPELDRHRRAGIPGAAQLRSGEIGNYDYPPAALRVDAQGTATIRFLIGINGRVQSCEVVQSSGNVDLDKVSCRVVMSRFRYLPAIGPDRRPAPEWRTQNIIWMLPDEPEQPPVPPGEPATPPAAA